MRQLPRRVARGSKGLARAFKASRVEARRLVCMNEPKTSSPLRALVTGGTSGIGRALVRGLLSQGAQVLTCGRDPGRIEALRTEQPNLRVVPCDLTEAEDLAALVAQVDVHLGGLDLLVCNAGVQQPFDLLADPDPDLLRQELEVNLLDHPERVAQAALEGLETRRPVVRVGKARLANLVHRWAPGLLARSLARAAAQGSRP